MSSKEQQRVVAVTAILMNKTLSNWARKYWTKVLTQLLLNSSGDENLVSHSAGLPHLWSKRGTTLKTKLLGEQ